MSYTVDALAPAPGGRRQGAHEATIVVVGCGGTGAFLAARLARLLLGRRARLCLVDPDRVEARNIARQDFARRDVGRHKVDAVAERLRRAFPDLEVLRSTLPYLPAVHRGVFGDGYHAGDGGLRLVVGCVDNGHARRAIAETLVGPAYAHHGGEASRVFWLDCGNERNAGQILLGNALAPEGLCGAFDRATGVCRALPAPSLQRPDLLLAPPDPPPGALAAAGCAEALMAGDQNPTINAFVADLAADWVHKLLTGRCRWMADYFNNDDGTRAVIPADPARVARLAGLHRNAIAPPTGARRAA
jgi:ThiF family